MKLQNLSVIFVLIVLPLILVLSYYISLQADTINLQAAYNSKLSDSTKEAIDAFEINTTEWNANYSDTADSKRRDVMASINTFITSFSNNIGIGGTSRENILSYMPAIVYTLYDGYYIYSPADVKPVIKDDNGVAVILNKDLFEGTSPKITGCTYDEADYGKLLYEPRSGVAPDGYYEGKEFTLDPDKAKDAEYKHILKPYAPYSEKIEGTNLVINYTLDNYITIYGELEDGDEDGTNDKYVLKSGYLTKTGKISNPEHNKITGIKFDGKTIEPEVLEEQIEYEDDSGNMHVDSFIYVYEAEKNTKFYYDNGRQEFFRLDGTKRKWIKDLSEPVYKKCTVPRYNSEKWTYSELYQNLSNGDWYTSEDKEVFNLRYSQAAGDALPSGMSYDRFYDYSAINYCVESWIFTNWYNTIISGEIGTDNQYYISGTNDPEDEKSAFSLQRRTVIKERVNSDLQQSIASYSRNTPNEYRIPELKEEDWNQVLKNASIITFIQNIPIGMKYYNDYAIATSTINKEYVDPNEIYLNANGQKYYHTPYCTHLGENNLIGYRSADYLQKSYNTVNAVNEPITKYYYRHADNTNTHIDVEEACYSCLIQRAEYIENITNLKQKAYYTALARERYIARMSNLPPEIEPSYLLHVVMVDQSGNKISNGSAEYKVNGENWSIEKLFKIPETVPNQYNIQAVGIDRAHPDDEYWTNDTGSLDNRKETVLNELSRIPTYVSDPISKIQVNIIGYNSSGINISYSGNENVEFGAGGTENNFGRETFISSDVGTGYVNVKLKYEKNSTVEATNRVLLWANINDYNNLTLVTETSGITGKVRLAFENNGTTYYYSKDTFNITEGAKIYCEIPTDIRWYNGEWIVKVLDTNNQEIARSDKIAYYTIRDATGLKGFADAVNGTKPTGTTVAAKTVDRTFKLIADIPNVGDINPIAGIRKDNDGNNINDIWFDGTFDGQNHVIDGMRMNKGNAYNALGLFGWVGSQGIIKNLKISDIIVKYTGSQDDIKVGGLAGYCDTNDEKIKNIEIDGGSIEGTDYVGGLIGSSDRDINNCRVKNLSKIIATKGYSGGIAGYTTKDILASNVNNVNTIKGKTYTGGVAGYTQKSILDCEVNNIVTLQGEGDTGGIVGHIKGSISNNTTVKNIGTLRGVGSTGGIAGYIEKAISNCEVNTVTTLTGEGNVGGIVGYTKEEISNCKALNITTLSGTDSIGGIAGYIEKSINNCNAQINTISHAELFESGKTYKLYIGGIAGYTKGEILNSYINAVKIGLGNVKMPERSVRENEFLGIQWGSINKYIIGGIAGYTENNITSSTINNTVTIKGGKILYGSIILGYILDTYGESYTGGIIGFKKSSQDINSTWQADIKVSGYDNVGGIIGYNKAGNIQGITRSVETYGSGENVGGIVGLNTGSEIKNCINNGKVTKIQDTDDSPYGECVGGIVGLSSGTTIKNCENKKQVEGDLNVGGIVGLAQGGSIVSVKNNGQVNGKNNVILGAAFQQLVMWSNHTGTGGIAGKLYNCNVENTANHGKISANVNAGGIAGVNWSSQILYTYNKGNVEADQRLGGICGHGSDVNIEGCYNIGEIKGRTELAGIMGTCVNNTYYAAIDIVNVKNKYLGTFDVPTIDIGETENFFTKCYNAGKITDTNTIDFIRDNAGILGCRMQAITVDKNIKFNKCYYVAEYSNLEDFKHTLVGEDSIIVVPEDEIIGVSKAELKKQLYIWATETSGRGGFLKGSTQVFATTAPLEDGTSAKGFEGYGILWWELPSDYVKIEAYVCSGYNSYGTTRYKAILNGHNTTFKIQGKSKKLEDSSILHRRTFTNGSITCNDVHCWVMRVKKGNYTFEGLADNYGSARDTHNIARNTKVFILLQTGSENVKLEVDGNPGYNWNFSERRSVPTRRTYKDWNVGNLNTPGAFDDGRYTDIQVTYSANAGESRSESTSKIARVHLGGGNIFNPARKDLEYSWSCEYVGWKARWSGIIFRGYERHTWHETRSEKENNYIIPKCVISIPMQDLISATAHKDLPYNPSNCELTRADLVINCTYWMDDNIIDTLDFTGLAGDLLDELNLLRDNFRVGVNYGNLSSNWEQTIQYNFFTTEGRARNLPIRFNMDAINEVGENNRNLTITASWDAKYVGMTLEVDSIELIVDYSVAIDGSGSIYYYNL